MMHIQMSGSDSVFVPTYCGKQVPITQTVSSRDSRGCTCPECEDARNDALDRIEAQEYADRYKRLV